MTAPIARWADIKALFESTVELAPAARETRIAASALDAKALRELRSLLAHHDAATGGQIFMAASAAQAWTEAPAAAAQSGQRLGAWEIVRPIGAGGMGEVFEARRADGQYDGRAAVKLLKRGMDSAAVLQRFAQERQALARLSHPHIARLLDAGSSVAGLPYFVLEYVEGQPIDTAMQGLALEQRLRLFLQLADAVAHAHRNLLVHRDLKPGNVLVDSDGQVKLLDFGIAKALDPMEQPLDGGTVAGQRPFTPHYASPEQVRGEPVSTATDIYSLGVLLYQMLTGIRPTGRKAMTPADAARSVLEETPTRPSRLTTDEVVDPQWLQTRRTLEGDLDNILLKALEKAPERRYASVDAFAADLRAYMEGRPVSARPAGWTYVAGKFVRRNRWAVLAGSLGLASLVLGLGLALHQGREAALARDEARRQLAGVKDIATELVFRYGDAIQLIPGGAKAQEAMLKQTVASLDVTLRGAPDDAELNVLMASALGRLAQIQGNPTFAGTDRAAEGRATVARALALGDKVWDAKRGEVRFVSQHLITLLTHANMLRNAGEVAQGLAVLSTAAERSGQTLQQTLSDTDRANVLELRANVLTNMAHFNDHSGRPSLGRPQEALRHYRESEAAFQALYDNPALVTAMAAGTDPGSPPPEEWANHNLANVRIGRALVYQRLRDFAAMKAEAEAALERRRDNVRRNPGSAIWRQSLMFDSNYLAIALLQLGDNAPALVASQQAWDLLSERLRQEGPQALWLTTQGNFAPQQARALAANGHDAQALPVFKMAIQRAHAVLKDKDSPVMRARLAGLQVAQAQAEWRLGDKTATLALLHPALVNLRSLPSPLDADAQSALSDGTALLAVAGGH